MTLPAASLKANAFKVAWDGDKRVGVEELLLDQGVRGVRAKLTQVLGWDQIRRLHLPALHHGDARRLFWDVQEDQALDVRRPLVRGLGARPVVVGVAL